MICVFTGGYAPSPELCETFFNQFDDKKIKTIIADSGLHTFEEYQNHFNLFELKSILGDWDSIKDKSILNKYPKEIIENHIVDKDYTDTELALDKAHSLNEINNDNEQIVLIGAGGGNRIDHLLAVFDIFSTELKPNIWISGEQFLYLLEENSSAKIHNIKIDDMISFFRTSNFRSGGELHSKGLKWESDLFRKDGVPSISNRISPEYFENNLPIEINVIKENYVLVVPYSAIIKS